jgi:hypothetical protein
MGALYCSTEGSIKAEISEPNKHSRGDKDAFRGKTTLVVFIFPSGERYGLATCPTRFSIMDNFYNL